MPGKASGESSQMRATLWLVLAQALGLLIPLLTLPVLARALGVAIFGQLMLAHTVIFLGVLFVDAGFNTESQRRAAIAKDSTGSYQVLLDNLLARAICSLPVVILLLLAGYLFANLPLRLILLSLPLLLGTLVFPQWWYIAGRRGFLMAVAATGGRLISAMIIFLWVRTPEDVGLAAVAATSASLMSGLMLLPHWGKGLYRQRRQLHWQGWKPYLQAVRHAIFSGFFASASASLPLLALGFFSNALQTGWYACADRLTRAAAYLLSAIEQSAMGWLAKKQEEDAVQGARIRTRLLQALALLLLPACLILAALATSVLHLLYGQAFTTAAPILQALAGWLYLYAIRRAALMFFWSARARLHTVAQIQWLEAILVSSAAIFGALSGSGLNTAIALGVVEAILLTLMWVMQRRSST